MRSGSYNQFGDFSTPMQNTLPRAHQQPQNQIHVKNEQIRAQTLKDQIDTELRNNRITSDEFEKRMESIRVSIMRKEDQLGQVQQMHDTLLTEKQIFEQEHDDAKNHLEKLQVLSSYQEKQEKVMNEYIQKNKHVLGLENDFQREMLQLRQDSNAQAQQMHAHWAPKLKSIDDRFNQKSIQNDNLNHQIFQFKELFLKMRLEHDSNVKNIEARCYAEEKGKYTHHIEMISRKEAEAHQELKTAENKRNEINQNQERLETNFIREKNFIENELQMERERLHTLHQKMSKRNIKLESLKNKNMVLDAHLDTLIARVEETNRHLLETKDVGIEDIQAAIMLHEQQYQITKHNQSLNHQRILDLEMLLRNQESQTSRVRSEYDKLCQILQNKVSQTVSDVIKQTLIR